MTTAPKKHAGVRPSDGELMRQLADGNLSALGVLYDRYGDAVRHFVRRVTGDEGLAEDVSHDAFLALVDASKRFDEAYPARSFLIGIAGKMVMRERRRSAVAVRVVVQLRHWLRNVDGRTPEATSDASELLARYDRALEGLSEAKRVVVVMADLEGMKGAEIAEALGIPLDTVWTRLHYARAELRRGVFGEGGK